MQDRSQPFILPWKDKRKIYRMASPIGERIPENQNCKEAAVGDKVLSQAEADSLISGFAVKTPDPPANAAKPAERPTIKPVFPPFIPAARPVGGQPAQPATRQMAKSSPSDEPALPNVKEVSLNSLRPAPAEKPAAPPDNVTEMTFRIDELTRRMAILEDRLTQQIAVIDMARLTTPEINPEKFEMFSNRVEEVSESIKIMAACVQATLGYDVYHTFQCAKCGSKGYVATLFKCTKCGGESWRGWWPKKSSK